MNLLKAPIKGPDISEFIIMKDSAHEFDRTVEDRGAWSKPRRHKAFIVRTSVDENSATARLFKRLSEKWQNETQFSSSVREIAMHPAYQKIIAMGSAALPHIFQALQKQNHHWFWALEVLCDINPVPLSERGNMPRTREIWIEYGRLHHLLNIDVEHHKS